MKKNAEKITLQFSHVQAYRYIDKYIKKHLVSPEIVEVAKGIKFTPRHTHRVIDELVTLGYLTKEAYRKRSIKIVRPLK